MVNARLSWLVAGALLGTVLGLSCGCSEDDSPANSGAGGTSGGTAGGSAGETAGGSAGGSGGGTAAGTVTLNVKDIGSAYADKPLILKLVAGAIDCGTDTSSGAYFGVGTVTAGTCTIVIGSVAPGVYTACAIVDVDGNDLPSPGDFGGELSLVVAGDHEEAWSASDWIIL